MCRGFDAQLPATSETHVPQNSVERQHRLETDSVVAETIALARREKRIALAMSCRIAPVKTWTVDPDGVVETIP